VALIEESEKTTLFCGIGCADAREEVIAFAGRLHEPVGHSLRGKDSIQYENPFDVGMSGLLGYGACYEAMHECDLLILLGTDWPYESFYPTKCKIVQIDIRPERLGRRSRLDLGLCGDVGETLRALLPRIPRLPGRSRSSRSPTCPAPPGRALRAACLSRKPRTARDSASVR